MNEVPTGSVAIMSTFNNLSVVGYQKFLDKILEFRKKYNNKHRKVLLDIPHLQAPHHQSVQILTPDFLDIMDSHVDFMEKNKDALYGFKEAEIFKMKRVRQWMKEDKDPEWVNFQRKNFYFFFKEHDKRRDTNFLQTFPEMKEFWTLCENLA